MSFVMLPTLLIGRVRVDRKDQEVEWPGGWAPTGVGSRERKYLNFEFSSEMQGFMHFYCEKLYLSPETRDQGV